MGDKIQIDKKLFWSRYGKIYQDWKNGGKMWGPDKPVDALLMVYGESDEDDALYARSTAVQNYLLGYEMQDVVFLITDTTFYVLAGSKKIRYISEVGTSNTVDDTELKLECMTKSKGDALKDDLQALLGHFAGSKEGKRLGIVKKDYEKCKGKFSKKLRAAIDEAGTELVDVSLGFAGILAVKDQDGVACIKKAGQSSTQVLKKFLLQKLESVIDEDKKIKHSELAEQTEDSIQDPGTLNIEFKAEDLEVCYSPIIQSGGTYDLKPSATCDDEELHHGVIVCALGIRYKNFCSNIARTYFVDPSDDIKKVYGILLQVFTTVKANLRPGKRMQEVYKAAIATIKKSSRPDLQFTKNCGCGIGLEFREQSLILSEKNQRVIAANMVFNVSIGFEGVIAKDAEMRKDPQRSTYAVFLADTFLVTNEEPKLLTHCKREWKEVSYFLGNDEEEEAEEEDVKEEVDRTRAADQRQKDMVAHQKELEKKLRSEAMERLSKKGVVTGDDGTGNILSYKNISNIPKKVSPNHIHVDDEHESVILPICGQAVPFHIGTLKNVTKMGGDFPGDPLTIRITFMIPGESGLAKPVSIANDKQVFIRELSFKSTSSKLVRAYHAVSQLLKQYKQMTKERKTRASLVTQEDLIINKKTGPIAKLREISIRPLLSKRKATGILIAHENGFRYTSSDKIKLDIIYKNIKQAFFQPAKNTHQVILHLQLHNPIKVDTKGSKKTDYVQVFQEVVEQSQDISGRGSYHDEDGLLEEQNERRKRMRANKAFHDFVKKVGDAVPKARKDNPELDFDIPYEKLAFDGVPNRENVKIYPTVHSLVALHDTPPMAISLDEVELCFLERVSNFNLRSFDLAFVFKDYDKPVMRIDTIPSLVLDKVRKWLNSMDIKYYETAQNYNWKELMKEIMKDKEGFFEDGGWAQFGGDDDDEGDQDEDDEESDFEPEEEESESESEEYESEEDDETSESEFDSEEDEGEDWDELDKKAMRDDREQSSKDNLKEREERVKMQQKGRAPAPRKKSRKS